MSVTLYKNLMEVDVVRSTFPGGESCIRIESEKRGDKDTEIMISLEFQNNGDLIDLAMMLDACKRHYHPDAYYILFMPYLPYARQDRVCNPGESLSVKVVCDFINSLGFPKVVVKDIHSSVGVALLNNLSHVELKAAASMLPFHEKVSETTLVSPDAGAEKKVFDFAKAIGYTGVLRASKVRNVLTGKIERTTLIDAMPCGTTKVIVDDICDGGRTFIELAKAIKADEDYQGERICLYVTHGIFSAGLAGFEGLIDKIYVSNLMNKSLESSPLIKII